MFRKWNGMKVSQSGWHEHAVPNIKQNPNQVGTGSIYSWIQMMSLQEEKFAACFLVNSCQQSGPDATPNRTHPRRMLQFILPGLTHSLNPASSAWANDEERKTVHSLCLSICSYKLSLCALIHSLNSRKRETQRTRMLKFSLLWFSLESRGITAFTENHLKIVLELVERLEDQRQSFWGFCESNLFWNWILDRSKDFFSKNRDSAMIWRWNGQESIVSKSRTKHHCQSIITTHNERGEWYSSGRVPKK